MTGTLTGDTREPPVPARDAARTLGAGALGLTLAALALSRSARRPARRPVERPAPRAADPAPAAARQLYTSAALLAASVLTDSGIEHYRGQFDNPGMFAPLASAALVLACAVPAALARSAAASGRQAADWTYGAACAVGAAGLGFHAYNVLRRPGGLSWANLFYAAPLGAPAALSLAGLLGLSARRVAQGDAHLAGLPAGQALSLLSAVGLAGTSAEAGLLHFRGAFHNPAMWIPVSLPPAGAALLAAAGVQAPQRPSRLTRALLKACAWMGYAGVAFHARGIARQMGGWRNWSQNLLAGPPLPAPPSFSALAVAGSAALALRERDGRAGVTRREAA